jgi:hypothetical protein
MLVIAHDPTDVSLLFVGGDHLGQFLSIKPDLHPSTLFGWHVADVVFVC